MPDAERRAIEVARRQHSVISRAQAVEAGLSPSAIDRLVRSGRWERIYSGVYIPAGVALTWKQQLSAACLACGRDSVASHRSALAVWGFAEDLFVPELTVPSSVRRQRPGVEIHRTDSIERCHRDGFRVTKPMRTLLDAAGCVPVDRLDRMIDDAFRRQLAHLETFRRYASRDEHRSRPGAGVLRSLPELRTPGRPMGSDLETMLFAILRRAGLPLPEPQYAVETRLGTRYLDFAYPASQIAIEVDGFETHGGRAAFETDRARQNEVELLGFRFLRFTWTQITRSPVDVGITVGLALGLKPVRWHAG